MLEIRKANLSQLFNTKKIKNKKWSIDHANTTTRIPGTTSATIAGFFRDDSNAENAIEELRAAGFSDREIGVATPHQEGKVGKFWNKLTSRFEKHEHTQNANDLEERRTG